MIDLQLYFHRFFFLVFQMLAHLPNDQCEHKIQSARNAFGVRRVQIVARCLRHSNWPGHGRLGEQQIDILCIRLQHPKLWEKHPNCFAGQDYELVGLPRTITIYSSDLCPPISDCQVTKSSANRSLSFVDISITSTRSALITGLNHWLPPVKKKSSNCGRP